MEYYKYKNRDEVAATPQVDWNAISNGLRKTLTDQEAARQDKRDILDKQTQDTIHNIESIDAGNNASMSGFILDAANSAKIDQLQQQKMMKAGLLNPNDYKIKTQNKKDGFTAFSNITKNWNANYDTFMDRVNKGTAAQQEIDSQKMMGDLQNMQNKKAYVDPISGNMYVAAYKDGKIDTSEFQPQNAQWLNNTNNFKIDKVDVTTEISKNQKIADYKDLLTKNGWVSLEDATKRGGFDSLSKDIANGILSNARRTGSVLTDYVGGFTTTFKTDPKTYTEEEKKADAAGNLIRYKIDSMKNYQPDISPVQRERAVKAIKTNLESQLKFEKKVEHFKQEFAPREPKEEKPAPVVPTTQDIRYTTSTEVGGKKTSRSGFTMDVPVIDKSTGIAQNLKAIYIDPITKELRIKIEEKAVVDGVTTVSDNEYSSKKKGDVAPDISKISNVATQIYDPARRRYLSGYQELYDYLKPQAVANWKNIQKGGGSQTTASGIKYTVE